MGDPAAPLQPKNWDEFDSKYGKSFMTPEEERKMEMEQAKQEYFAELKREADFKKKHPEFDTEDEKAATKLDADRKLKQAEIPEEWKDLTPAKR